MTTALGPVRYRVGQFARALSPRVPVGDCALAAAVLAPDQFVAFRRMGAADQRHAVRVLRLLLAAGTRDPDLVVAALLHDLGKVDPGGAGRVRLPHRVAKVLLGRLWPGAWDRLSARRRSGPALGCYLLRHHPALGAAWAARLDCTPRTRALIAAHQGTRNAERGTRNGNAAMAAADLETLLHLLRCADDQA